MDGIRADGTCVDATRVDGIRVDDAHGDLVPGAFFVMTSCCSLGLLLILLFRVMALLSDLVL